MPDEQTGKGTPGKNKVCASVVRLANTRGSSRAKLGTLPGLYENICQEILVAETYSMKVPVSELKSARMNV